MKCRDAIIEALAQKGLSEEAKDVLISMLAQQGPPNRDAPDGKLTTLMDTIIYG